jgi:hypothetical protein
MPRRLAIFPRGWIVWGPAALLLAAACGMTLPAWADDGPGNRATLKGIPAVKVVVAPTILEGEWDRLRTDELETDVERRLREAGIAVLPSATEVLYIEVEARKTSGSPRYACSTRVELLQSVSLVREPGLTVFAPTWGLGRVEEVSAYNLRSLRVTVGELVDSFIQAYREQNPKR